MPKLSDASLMHFAQDLTKIALEHDLIPDRIKDDFEKTTEGKAKCVASYYKTLLATLNPEE